eukprot:869416-Prymnesium_polylepis.1
MIATAHRAKERAEMSAAAKRRGTARLQAGSVPGKRPDKLSKLLGLSPSQLAREQEACKESGRCAVC